jgi:diguanylate cyclase (GGDEF)-like protein
MRRLTGRSGAVFFVVVGVLTISDTLMRGDSALRHVNAAGAIISGAVCIVLGAVMWFLPWERWSVRAPMVVPYLIVLIGIPLDRIVHFSTDPSADASYGMLCFTLLAWIGLSQPRWTAARFAPLLAAVLAVNAATSPGSVVDVSVPLVIVPVAVVLAEICGWTIGQLRHAQRLDVRRVESLEALATPLDAVDAAGVERQMAVRAVAVFGARGASTVRGPAAGLEAVAGDPLPPGGLELARRAVRAGAVAIAGDGELLALPLQASGTTVGSIVVDRPRQANDPFTTNLARLFGLHAGSALVQRRLIDDLSSDARRDPLTGVGNRRQARELLDGLRPGDAIVLVDIDGFKGINDTSGHQAGDEVLVMLAAFLVTLVGTREAVARLGGDEFLVVVRHGGDRAVDLARRLVRAWREEGPGATVSVGLAVHADAEHNETVRRADRALYRAKELGRDQLVLDEVVPERA